MADKDLQVALSSGVISGVNLGGTASADKVLKKSEIDASYGTLTAQNDQEVRLQDLEATGISVRAGSNIPPQTIGVTATKVVNFDTTLVEAGVGAEWDVINGRMTATLDGIYKLRYESFITYASNVDITWQIYKSGVPFGQSITLSGQGTTVFPLVLLSSSILAATEYLELYATASASTSLVIAQANGTLEKTHF